MLHDIKHWAIPSPRIPLSPVRLETLTALQPHHKKISDLRHTFKINRILTNQTNATPYIFCYIFSIRY
ncbi:hypothetical protein C5471_08495 [Photorhabdus tasmaniensis]|uniref:Uncharacterized protein n=1 Tax=Photorhabdus tasmaniensis TaxID=1004159 RepID=A0ABX0GF35_9GAMM|nr:hypothetical protein [Photorhabdus tasmaniensis]